MGVHFSHFFAFSSYRHLVTDRHQNVILLCAKSSDFLAILDCICNQGHSHK